MAKAWNFRRARYLLHEFLNLTIGLFINPRPSRAAEIGAFGVESHENITDMRPQEIAKKRTRRTVKQQRGIVGASLDVIKERRSMRPEARTAARAQAIKEGKDKKAAAESKKKAEKAKSASATAQGKATQQTKFSKQQQKGAPQKVQAKTR